MITRTRIGFLILTLTLAITATAAGLLYTQFARTTTSLHSTQAELQDTTLDLTTTTAVLTETQGQLHNTRSALTDERITRDQLQFEHNALSAHNNELQLSLTMANDDKTALQTSLATATTTNTTLQQDLSAAADLETELRSSLDHAAERYTNLNATKDRIDAERRDLLRTHGSIEELRAQRTQLQADITILQEQRLPLILNPSDTRNTGFKCTGSMEPKVTCLDTATWLSSFGPNDIVVGATISFSNTACEPDGSRQMLAHRVIEIRTVAGQQEYLAKGDANSEPDCWLPHSAVNAYITAIHKNTTPENEELRNKVNSWRHAYDAAFQTADTAHENYEPLYTAYQALRTQHGCPQDITKTCYAKEPAYSELSRAYIKARDAYRAFNTALSAYGRAKHYYTCWLNTAQRSQYPGHILYLCAPYVEAPPTITIPSQ